MYGVFRRSLDRWLVGYERSVWLCYVQEWRAILDVRVLRVLCVCTVEAVVRFVSCSRSPRESRCSGSVGAHGTLFVALAMNDEAVRHGRDRYLYLTNPPGWCHTRDRGKWTSSRPDSDGVRDVEQSCHNGICV